MDINMPKMLINGQLVKGKSGYPVLNPATEVLLTEAPMATADQVNQAVEAANLAFKSWGAPSNQANRQAILSTVASRLAQHIEEIAALLTQEQGKPLKAALSEVESGVHKIETIISYDIFKTVLQSDSEANVEMHLVPFGVVAAITPWNYPVYIALAKIISALWLGNTVVLKPSEYTPLSTLKIAELIHDLLPKGVLNVLSGTGEVGALLTQHPLVRMVSFTGSVPTGKKIAAACADDLKRVTLELGGNDAAIILDDVSIDEVSPAIFWGAFSNSGQICTAIKRVFVPNDKVDELATKLNELAADVIVGNGEQEDTQMGPINNDMQYKKVLHYYQLAKDSGAKVWGGGPVDGPGYFFKPTIVSDIHMGHPLVDEEQFGPVLPLIGYDSIEDAIQQANALNMGLGGSIWSQDQDRAYELAQQIDSGTVWVNTIHASHQDACFGGVKHSGLGREGGIEGLKSFGEYKVIYQGFN